VVGVPTNIKLMRRILAHPTFQEGKYDTGFIAQNEKTLLKKIRDPSHMRMGTIAIVKVFLESLKVRTKRASALLPWEQFDMFRLNNRSMREVQLKDHTDPTKVYNFTVEYLDEHKFNCYVKNEQGWLTPVLLDAEVEMNPETRDEVFVRTDSEQFKVDFYIDKDETVTQLDYENAPLPFVSCFLILTLCSMW